MYTSEESFILAAMCREKSKLRPIVRTIIVDSTTLNCHPEKNFFHNCLRSYIPRRTKVDVVQSTTVQMTITVTRDNVNCCVQRITTIKEITSDIPTEDSVDGRSLSIMS